MFFWLCSFCAALAISPPLLECWHQDINLLSYLPLFKTKHSLIPHPTQTLDSHCLYWQPNFQRSSITQSALPWPPSYYSLSALVKNTTNKHPCSKLYRWLWAFIFSDASAAFGSRPLRLPQNSPFPRLLPSQPLPGSDLFQFLNQGAPTLHSL